MKRRLSLTGVVASLLRIRMMPEEKEQAAVQKLRSMANRIEHNKDAMFGGACVIVLPDGESVEFVTLDAQPDVAQFISAVATRLQILQNQQELKTRQGGFGGR